MRVEAKALVHRTDQHTLTCYFLVVFILFAVSLLFSPLQFTYWMNGFHSNALDFFFVSITNLGDGIFTAIFVFVLLFYRFYLALALLLNGLMQGLVVSICKRVLFADMLRPVAYMDPTIVHTVEGVELHRLMSFPSGHTVTVFGLCLFLSLCFRNKTSTIFLLIISLLVGLSRIYLLQHFIVDVAAGALVGSSIGATAYYIFENIKKPKSWSRRIVVTVAA